MSDITERLRINPPTPTGTKGPNFSHYHINDKPTHYIPNGKDPGFNLWQNLIAKSLSNSKLSSSQASWALEVTKAQQKLTSINMDLNISNPGKTVTKDLWKNLIYIHRYLYFLIVKRSVLHVVVESCQQILEAHLCIRCAIYFKLEEWFFLGGDLVWRCATVPVDMLKQYRWQMDLEVMLRTTMESS